MQNLFISGGCGRGVNGDPDSYSDLISNVFRYSPHTNTWTEMKKMKSGRNNHELVTLNDLIYAIGGFGIEAECYNPTTNEWNYVAAPRNFLKSVTSHQNKIYVLSSRSFEVFIPEFNTWQKLQFPPNGIKGKLISINDKLLLIAKTNYYKEADEVLYEFNITNNSWSKLLDLKLELWDDRAVVVNFS